jgi:hypothetical protein
MNPSLMVLNSNSNTDFQFQDTKIGINKTLYKTFKINNNRKGLRKGLRT